MYTAYLSATICLLLSIFIAVFFVFLLINTGRSPETLACFVTLGLSITVTIATIKQAITYYKYTKLD